MLALLISLLFFLRPAWTQTPRCFVIEDCSESLKLEIIRDDPPQECAEQDEGCGGTDYFYHVRYRVYLRYEADDNTDDADMEFDLDYHRLNARVRLYRDPTDGYSRIDKTVSKKCFEEGVGAGWLAATFDNVVVWDELTEDEIAVDFMNDDNSGTDPCDPDYSNVIHFSLTEPNSMSPPPGVAVCPTGKKCSYVELFPVVVLTYPGEEVRLECADFQYISNDLNNACSPSDCASNQVNNASGLFFYAEPTPDAPAGVNADLLVRLSNPAVPSGAVTNAYEFDIEIVNNDATSATVYYVEFMAKLTADVALPPLVFDGNYATPISVREDNSVPGTTTFYVYYSIPFDNGLTLPYNTPAVLSTVIFGPPAPYNQIWTATAELIEESSSRVRSGSECSWIPLSEDKSEATNDSGDPVCSDVLETEVFTIFGENGSGDCSTPIVKLGFETSNTPNAITFDYFQCELQFDWTGDLSVSTVSFGSDTWNCPFTTLTCASGCWEVVGTDILRIEICATEALLLDPSAFLTVEFEGFGCINGVHLLALRYRGENEPNVCAPLYDDSDQGFPICSHLINGRIATEDDTGVEGVTVKLDRNLLATGCGDDHCDDLEDLTADDGLYAFCACMECEEFTVTPAKDDNPMNGVSTFDLVLMSKHILGITPLPSPYKIIAADINKSNSVTSFDIVELRKLILGIYNDFPNNTSWRFILKEFEFTDDANPFVDMLEDYEFALVPPNSDFIGIKIGDLSGDVVANRPSAERPLAALYWPEVRTKAGSILALPVRYAGTEPLEAIQLGLRFDTSALTLLGPSAGDLPGQDAGSFGLTRAAEGEIRALWVFNSADLERLILSGDVLFYLHFQVKSAPSAKSGAWLRLDDAVLPNAGWRPDGQECALTRAPEAATRDAGFPAKGLRAECRPNPSSGAVSLTVSAERPIRRGHLAVFGPFGARLFARDVSLVAGEQSFELPEVAALPAGVYVWKVYGEGAKAQGHLIRQ